MTTMATSSEAPVSSPVAHFRKLRAAKKLQRQLSSPSEESAAPTNDNAGTKAKATDNSENHHPNNAQSTSAKPTPRRLARGLGNSRIQQNTNETNESLLESSTWAMVGNHLDETNASSLDGASFASGAFEQTFEQTFHTAEMAITPAPIGQKFEWNAEEVRELLFSPLFKNQEGIVGDEGVMSPIAQSEQNDKENGNRVKWALDDMTTPKNGGTYEYRKSPFVKGDMTPAGSELNESVVVSDHEEDSVEEKGELHGELFPNTEFVDELNDGFTEVGRSFDSPPSIRESLAFDMDSMEEDEHVGFLGTEIEEEQHTTDMSPTKEALKERAKFLATEVRFADQTCVELSQKLKNEKKAAGRFKNDLGHAKEEHKSLQKQHESTLQENAKLKVLLEAEKEKTSIQIEEYRAQITTMQEDNRANLQEWEQRYASHMKNTENQINALNERLAQSIEANSTLQNRLDKWDFNVGDEASKEVIADLKERVEAAEASASKADATIQTMQARIYDLQSLCQQHQNTIQRERNEREIAEDDRDEWRRQCEDLHRQLTDWHGKDALDTSGSMYFNDDGSAVQEFIQELKFTPIKGEKDGELPAGHHSPTSNLLARTLRSEQKRRKDALDQLEVAELEVEKLQNEVEDLNVELEEAKADNVLLAEDLQDKCSCIEEMKGALAQKEEHIELLMEEIEVLGTEASADTTEKSVSTSKSSQGRAIDDLEGRLEVTQQALESTEEELTATRRQLAESEAAAEEIAGELEKAEQDLALADEQMLECDDRIVALNKELQEKQGFSEFQTRTIDTLKSQIKEYNVQLKSSLHALVKVEKILRTYEDSGDLAKQKLGEQSRKIARLEDTIKAIKDSLAQREVETSSTQTPVTHLLAQSPMSNMSILAITPGSVLNEVNGYHQEKLNELRCEVATAHERCGEVEKERDEIGNELKKALRCVQEFRDELSNQEHEHSHETSSLQRQLEAVSTQKEGLVQKCQQLEQKLARTTTELTQRKTLSEALARDIATAQNQIAVVIGNNSEALEENESLRVDLDALQIELENAQSLLKAATEECQGSHKDVKAAKAAFECMQAESLLTKNTLRKVEEEAAMLKASLHQKEAEIKKQSDSITKAKDLLQSERVKFEETQKSNESRHQNEIKALQSHIQELKNQVQETQEQCDACKESLDNASNRINLLESMLTTTSQECELYQAECKDLTAELRSMENNLAGAEEELSEAQVTMRDQMEEIEQLEDKLKECKSCITAYEESCIDYKEQVRHLQTKNSNLQRELDDAVGSYHAVVYEKEHQVNMLKEACTKRQILFDEQLERAKLEHDSTTSDFEAMVEILQTQLNIKAEDVNQAKSLISAKNDLLNEKDAEISECEEVISDLRRELLEQDNLKNELEQEIARKQGQIETLQNSLDEAGGEIAQTVEKLYALEMTHDDLIVSKNAVQRELESTLMDIERMKTNHEDDQSTSNSLIKDLQSENDELNAQKKSAQDSVTALSVELRETKEKLNNVEQKLQAEGESNSKQHHDINDLLAQNASLTKKSNLFKEKLKQLNEKLRDWETSYRLQSKELVDYGREISRLNTEKNTLKAELLAVRGSSDRYKSKLNRINQTVNTPEGGVQPYWPTTL